MRRGPNAAAPPQLHFDDGSRVIQEAASASQEGERRDLAVRGTTQTIDRFYEVDRISKKVIKTTENAGEGKGEVRVALQFPDGLLHDAPEVCWAMEEALSRLRPSLFFLVFVLGDTTFASCCPDEVTALHLNADVLVHYGHACLSPTASLPVIYSFGVTDMDVPGCIEAIKTEAESKNVRRLLIMHDVRYNHAMEDIETQLSERGDLLVLSGHIPEQATSVTTTTGDDGALPEAIESPVENEKIVLGGLEIPANLDLSTYTFVFIGDDDTSSRQYVDVTLRLLTFPGGQPNEYWSYSPRTKQLETSLPKNLTRQLNRRFFLTQKARDASIFGILVGTLSQRHFTSVVDSLRQVIENSGGRSCYTFAVGKVNPAKLANFAEIECYVLVACGENSLLDFERDVHVPVITPLELSIALGVNEWGEYSLDYNEFLVKTAEHSIGKSVGTTEGDESNGDDEEEQEDAPYFSLVTGKYVDRKGQADPSLNLKALPGGGQLTAYNSEAANFLRNREYQGLVAAVGETKPHAAKEGQVGIASNYGNK